MADTGAPWNLPYPLPTDLVRDGAQAIEDLAEATATGLSAAGNAGIGPNVASTTKTDVFSTTSTSFVEIDGLTATITPSEASSRILCVVSLQLAGSLQGALSGVRLRRGTTDILLGDAAGSRPRVSASVRSGGEGTTALAGTVVIPITFLDSPNTTDPVVYSLQIATTGGTLRVNASQTDGDSTSIASARATSSMTLIEVAE